MATWRLDTRQQTAATVDHLDLGAAGHALGAAVIVVHRCALGSQAIGAQAAGLAQAARIPARSMDAAIRCRRPEHGGCGTSDHIIDCQLQTGAARTHPHPLQFWGSILHSPLQQTRPGGHLFLQRHAAPVISSWRCTRIARNCCCYGPDSACVKPGRATQPPTRRSCSCWRRSRGC